VRAPRRKTLAGAAQDHHVGIRVGVDVAPHFGDFPMPGRVQRIEALWPVDGDAQDARILGVRPVESEPRVLRVAIGHVRPLSALSHRPAGFCQIARPASACLPDRGLMAECAHANPGAMHEFRATHRWNYAFANAARNAEAGTGSEGFWREGGLRI